MNERPREGRGEREKRETNREREGWQREREVGERKRLKDEIGRAHV